MKIICRRKNRKQYKLNPDSYAGYVDVDKLPLDEAELQSLVDNGWLRKKKQNGYTGFDINTKSGVRPKYKRLKMNDTTGTILTTDFRPREKLHPVENRGLSLREGARIQSFPDSFKFKGSFTNITNQIGNAVPPLLSYQIGKHLQNNL